MPSIFLAPKSPGCLLKPRAAALNREFAPVLFLLSFFFMRRPRPGPPKTRKGPSALSTHKTRRAAGRRLPDDDHPAVAAVEHAFFRCFLGLWPTKALGRAASRRCASSPKSRWRRASRGPCRQDDTAPPPAPPPPRRCRSPRGEALQQHRRGGRRRRLRQGGRDRHGWWWWWWWCCCCCW